MYSIPQFGNNRKTENMGTKFNKLSSKQNQLKSILTKTNFSTIRKIKKVALTNVM